MNNINHPYAGQRRKSRNEILLGENFWALVGGAGTYEELLEIYREVGSGKGKAMIDALAFGF